MFSDDSIENSLSREFVAVAIIVDRERNDRECFSCKGILSEHSRVDVVRRFLVQMIPREKNDLGMVEINNRGCCPCKMTPSCLHTKVRKILVT